MTFELKELFGAKVIGLEGGCDSIVLKLTNEKFVKVEPLYYKGLFIHEMED